MTAAADPNDPLEALKRKARVERAKRDLHFFRETYLMGPDNQPFRSGPHHLEMDREYHKHTNSVFCAPVGHAKSEWMKALIMWEICRDRGIHIIYASHSFNVAADMMAGVQYQFSQNEKLIQDFGEFFDDNTMRREAKFNVIGNHNPRVPTMMITGAKGRVENVRVERLFTDDVVTLDSALSEIERAKVDKWFFNEFYNRLNLGGKVCMIGSRFHPDDLYAKLKKSEHWKVIEYRAVVSWDDRKSLWPERWPFDVLEERRSIIGSAIFDARYQQDPSALFSAYFKPEYIQVIERDKIPQITQVFQGWDFNVSEKTNADYTVGMTVGVDEKGKWYVLDCFREHIKDGHAQEVINFWRRWSQENNPWEAPVNGVFCEDNTFQALIGNEIVKHAPSCPMIPVKRVKDRLMRILRIQPIFQQQRVFIAHDMPQKDNVITEILSFPSQGEEHHDDVLDALEAAMTYAVSALPEDKVQVIGSLDNLFEEKPKRGNRWWA